MPLTHTEVMQMEQVLMQMKLQDLQALSGQLALSKIGKKAELSQRLLARLRNPATQDHCAREINSYRQRTFNMAQHWNSGHSSNLGYQGPTTPTPKHVSGLRVADLPFYDVVEHILHQPIELASISSSLQRQRQRQSFTFAVNNARQELNYRSDSRPLPRYEVQLRFFQLTDDYRSKDQADDFPPDCSVKINEQVVTLPSIIPTNRPNVEPKRPSRPVNITPTLHAIDGPIGSRPYRMSIEWMSDRRAWACSINLVHHVTSQMLIERLNKREDARQALERTKNTIIRRLGGGQDDIEMEHLRTSLRCPLTRTKVRTPVRCSDCSHLQCYDLENYIQMNEKRPTWKCPVCSNPAPYARLIIDMYFVDVLEKTPPNVDEVELLPDGSWKIVSEESSDSGEDDTEDIKNVDLVSNGSKNSKRSEERTGPTSLKRKLPADEVITIEDSDDEESADIQKAKAESLKDAASTTSDSGSTSTAIAKNNEGPSSPKRTKTAIEVITLDDSPERPPRPTATSSTDAAAAASTSATSVAAPAQSTSSVTVVSSTVVGGSSTPNSVGTAPAAPSSRPSSNGSSAARPGSSNSATPLMGGGGPGSVGGGVYQNGYSPAYSGPNTPMTPNFGANPLHAGLSFEQHQNIQRMMAGQRPDELPSNTMLMNRNGPFMGAPHPGSIPGGPPVAPPMGHQHQQPPPAHWYPGAGGGGPAPNPWAPFAGGAPNPWAHMMGVPNHPMGPGGQPGPMGPGGPPPGNVYTGRYPA